MYEEAKKIGLEAIKYNRVIPSKKIFDNKYFEILTFFLKLFKDNFKIKKNYIYFYYKILLSIIKNETLFEKVKADFILQDRFYMNCPIKIFFSKK